ncbi:MAG: hypothetical protein KC910_12535 [Candidatus Eremiobacteraeota bacterium]|nr:hypothetical protein [Candidatus Eremiobacteraeota bacterium]
MATITGINFQQPNFSPIGASNNGFPTGSTQQGPGLAELLSLLVQMLAGSNAANQGWQQFAANDAPAAVANTGSAGSSGSAGSAGDAGNAGNAGNAGSGDAVPRSRAVVGGANDFHEIQNARRAAVTAEVRAELGPVNIMNQDDHDTFSSRLHNEVARRLHPKPTEPFLMGGGDRK